MDLYKRNEDGSLGKMQIDTDCHVEAIEVAVQFYKDLGLEHKGPILAVIPKFDQAIK